MDLFKGKLRKNARILIAKSESQLPEILNKLIFINIIEIVLTP
jgi:hypothetical protein